MPKHRFHCYNERGEQVEDLILDLPPPPTWRERLRWQVVRLIRRYTPFRWNLAYRLGLTPVRNITGIRIVSNAASDYVRIPQAD